MPPKAAKAGGTKPKPESTQKRDSSVTAEKKNTRKTPLRNQSVNNSVAHPSDDVAPENNSAVPILESVTNPSNTAASDAANPTPTESVSHRSPSHNNSDDNRTAETRIDIPETRAFLDTPGESRGTEPPPTNPSAGDHTTPVSSLISSKRVTVDDANLQLVVENNGHAEMETISTPQKINDNINSNVSTTILPCTTYFTTKLTLRNTNLLHHSIVNF